MRSLPRLLLIGLAGVALAAPVIGQRPDDQIQPQSVELQQQGKTLLAAGKLEQADDVLETALAVDPRNRGAFVDLARVAEKQHLFGKAIRMTNKALLLEPNDPDAIAVQGEAMVELGAIARAQANLAEAAEASAAPRAARRSRSLSAAISARADGRVGQGAGSSEEELSRQLRQRRASATNSSTLSVSARRSAVDPERRQRFERAGQCLQARAQHLAPLAEGGLGQLLHDRRASTPSGASAGTMWTTADVTLGGGTKAERLTVIAIRGSRAPLGRDRQPAVSLAAGRGDDPLGDLLLEHQGQRSPPRRPGRRRASAAAARCRHCRAGWRRHGRRRRRSSRSSISSASPSTMLEPVAELLAASSASAGMQRRSRSTATTLAPASSSARVSPPGPGPTS